MLTLPSVYNLDTVYYYHFKFQQMQGGDVHDYDIGIYIALPRPERPLMSMNFYHPMQGKKY